MRSTVPPFRASNHLTSRYLALKYWNLITYSPFSLKRMSHSWTFRKTDALEADARCRKGWT